MHTSLEKRCKSMFTIKDYEKTLFEKSILTSLLIYESNDIEQGQVQHAISMHPILSVGAFAHTLSFTE